VAELKGSQRLLFGSTYSHSGFKAPLITLWKEFDLHPERDYTPVFTASSEQAIADIAAGRGDAAPVASDFLQRVLSRDQIKPDSIRSIYKSKPFPPACFAYAHQLQPELATKIKTAFLDFAWADTSLEKAYAPANQSKFVPVTYQADWTAVREVEERAAALLKTNGGS
jgi:phosphonate transport system substrate-binding protein